MPGKRAPGHRARSLARRLALQALYQIQINPRPWQDTQAQFASDPEAERVDMDYFRELITAIAPNCEILDSRLARLCEIPPSERSEEHTSELQSHVNLVCRLLLEKKQHTKVLYLYYLEAFVKAEILRKETGV